MAFRCWLSGPRIFGGLLGPGYRSVREISLTLSNQTAAQAEARTAPVRLSETIDALDDGA
jgi:hypothetical protein